MEGFGFLIALAYLSAIAAFFVYVRNLQQVLRRCAPGSRALRPGLVWLQVIPCFGALWQFFVTRGLARSLANEWQWRGLPVPARHMRSIGVAKSIVDVFALVHVIGFAAMLLVVGSYQGTLVEVLFDYTFVAAGLLQLGSIGMWAMYWGLVSGQSAELGRVVPVA